VEATSVQQQPLPTHQQVKRLPTSDGTYRVPL
jgi:hypothetical protein